MVKQVLALVATLAPLAASAHDVWFSTHQRANGVIAVVNYGDTDKRELIERGKIVTLDLISPSGSADLRKGLTPATANGVPVLETGVLPSSSGAIIASSYDNGFWLTRPGDQKETNTSPLMEPKAIEPHWTVKYSKHLIGKGSSSVSARARGEFFPLKDPFSLTVGNTLPVKLVVDGKPLANVRVRYSDGIQILPPEKVPYVKTNAEGVAEVPLERKGPYLITADPNVAPSHPALSKADHVFVALSFDLNQ